MHLKLPSFLTTPLRILRCANPTASVFTFSLFPTIMWPRSSVLSSLSLQLFFWNIDLCNYTSKKLNPSPNYQQFGNKLHWHHYHHPFCSYFSFLASAWNSSHPLWTQGRSSECYSFSHSKDIHIICLNQSFSRRLTFPLQWLVPWQTLPNV